MSRDLLRVLGLFVLGRVAPETAVPRLVKLLANSDEETSAAAYMVLVKLGRRTAPSLLEEARLGHQSASVLQVIGDQGDVSVIPKLEVFLSSKDVDVAAAAVESIAVLRDEPLNE